MRTFKEVLKGLREEKNLSQKELAEDLGLGYSTIGMYENGGRMPKYEILDKIADYFNVDMDYLLGKTPIRNRYRDLNSFTQLNNSIVPTHFSTLEEAIQFIIQNDTVMASKGIDLSKMEEQEIMDLAQDIADYIVFISNKYCK